MRDLNNLNREHDDKLKAENKCEHKITRWDGVVPCTGREICNDCGKQIN